MKFFEYLRCAFATTFNIIAYAITRGRYIWLEGRVRKGVFRNWAGRFRYTPARFVQPTSEEEIVELVKSAKNLRLFGSAHSFNSGVVVEDTLVSLDRYSGVIRKDLEKKQLTVRGGTRVRDVVMALLKEGLAFAALPSHDAQSMAGILSTDVHGTGKDWGFVSQSVVSLKLIDGKGEIFQCTPSDDLFKAAIGGIGSVGIISEVVIQGVDRFNVEQTVQLSNLPFVEKNLDQLLQKNEHFSLYLFPFADTCQINTWNRTKRKRSFLGSLHEFVSISIDALFAVWLGNLLAYTRQLPKLSSQA
jgi:FAD/FMN-containing dehydrogenase